MATKIDAGQPLTGLPALLASQPAAQTPKGGAEFGYDGSSGGKTSAESPPDDAGEFAGLGPWLEDDDATVFRRVHDLVLRQELIAKNHLAQDTHWTRVKLGYPWSTLEKLPDQDVYRATLPYGADAISTQAVPNKAWDLVNKAAETLLVDFPQPDPQPLNDSEEAEHAADMAEKFLTQDAGESGTNDSALFYQALDKALTCASGYLHLWTDPTGGGYVPLQIQAHPQAVSPATALVGPDGMPTTDYVLRYVTTDGQFTTEPSQAAPQWRPKIRADIWGREHIRVFPETADIATAEKVIGLYYCTVGEARRRWDSVGAMSPDELSALCDWTPPRYLVLLPPFQRARWKLTSGRDTERAGASDERVLFFYIVYQGATPDHPKGASLYVSGANQGTILDKDTLAATVEMPGDDGTGPKQDVRCMDLPIVQIRPRLDADERDPSGRAYIELFGGASEFNATLALAYLEAMDVILHVEKYIPSTSPVEGWQIDEARASGDAIPILSPNDKPVYGQTPPLPPNFLDVMQWGASLTDSIASLNKPVQGANDQQEVSGRARAIAVQQAMVGLNRMQQAVNAAYERYCRIKIQLAMRDFSTPQQIRYVGEDGAYKASEWTGTDFALVGDVGIQAGTGTMMSPEAKVNYIGSLLHLQLLTPDDAGDAARPTFADALGLPDNPHLQYIERCIASWLQGPPQGWAEAFQTYQQQMAEYQAQAQALQAEAQTAAAKAQAMGVQPPQVEMPPQPQAPWTPFAPRINDAEPAVAQLWFSRLSKVISSVKYDAMDPAWRSMLDQKYQSAGQTLMALQPAPPLPRGVAIQMKGDASTVGPEIQAAVHPGQPAPSQSTPPASAGGTTQARPSPRPTPKVTA